MKTIAQQLNIKEFPFIIADKNGNVLYHEDSENYWKKYERDEYGYVRHYENSDGFYSKSEYDENGNERYYENSNGRIRDNRVKEMTIAEIEKALNINNLKIIK
jgi:hypothetical protein